MLRWHLRLVAIADLSLSRAPHAQLRDGSIKIVTSGTPNGDR